MPVHKIVVHTRPRRGQNLSLGFPTKGHSNQSPQLKRLAKIILLVASLDMIFSNQRITKTARMRRLVCTFVVRKSPKTWVSHVESLFKHAFAPF